jgi:hypothetical protein
MAAHDHGTTERDYLHEVAPCDACRFRDRCQQRLHACEAFSMYCAGEPASRWQPAPRAPCRARYEALLG